jgi:hypothetical protein
MALEGSEEALDDGDAPSKISDADMSSLFARLAALKEADVEEDALCAQNWKFGLFAHVNLVKANCEIRHVQLHGDMVSEQRDLQRSYHMFDHALCTYYHKFALFMRDARQL